MEFVDVLQAILLGLGLAMDAASVSMTNGMVEKKMHIKKMLFIALMFGIFQGAMPLIGYFLGSIFTEWISRYVPYIGFALLSFLGIKMLIDAFKNEEDESYKKITFSMIFVQAIATSIDALATGVIYIDYDIPFVIGVFSIVMLTTFIVSFIAIVLGKKFGELLNKHAIIFGGIILISIGFKLLLEQYFYVYIIVLLFLIMALFLIFKLREHKTNKVKLNKILKDLSDYVPYDEKEIIDKKIMLDLLEKFKEKVFDRKKSDIHFTSSAIVLNKNKDKVLFCYHKIYDSWSWLGGHADKEISLLEVARKEIKEESGLKDFEVYENKIFSIEILPVKEHIKNNKVVKEHKHANVTYVFIADEDSQLQINEKENSDVKFLDISSLENLVNEKHMLKIYNKIINKLEKEKVSL